MKDKNIEELIKDALEALKKVVAKSYDAGIDYQADVLTSSHLKLPNNGKEYVAKLDTRSNEVMMGVGDGSGEHYVRGDYDTIKLLQGKLFELEKLRFGKVFVVLSRDVSSFIYVTTNCDKAHAAKDNQEVEEEMAGGRPSVFIKETMLS